MLKLLWLDHFADDSLDEATALANQLYWNLSIHQGKDGETWYVHAGESLILRTDSKECLDAFLYGLGLAYTVLPEPVFRQLKEEIRTWVE